MNIWRWNVVANSMLNSKKSIAALVVIIGFVYLSIVFGFASKADFDATKHDMQKSDVGD